MRSNLPLTVVLGAFLLMCPALFNRAPLLYFDTAAYFANIAKAMDLIFPKSFLPDITTVSDQPSTAGQVFSHDNQDNIVYGGRSIYYGALAWLGAVTSIWLIVAVQAIALAWLVTLVIRQLVGTVRPAATLIIITILATTTSAGFFVGLIMPDIWAALAILAVALLWTPSAVPLSRTERGLIYAVLAFSALSHSSHLALIATLLVLGLLARPLRRAAGKGAVAIPVLAIATGLAGILAFSMVVRTVYGQPPLSRPFIMAHLVDLGPTADLIRETCPESRYALCEYADRLPMVWTSVLFGRGDEGVFLSAPDDQKRALVDEQVALLLHTLRVYPVELVTGLMADGVRQLWTLSIDSVPRQPPITAMTDLGFSPEMIRMTETSRLYANPGWLPLITLQIEIVTALSATLLLGWGMLRIAGRAGPTVAGLGPFMAVCLVGVMSNALICGILASPYGRFQARVVWILPLLILLIVMLHVYRTASEIKAPRKVAP